MKIDVNSLRALYTEMFMEMDVSIYQDISKAFEAFKNAVAYVTCVIQDDQSFDWDTIDAIKAHLNECPCPPIHLSEIQSMLTETTSGLFSDIFRAVTQVPYDCEYYDSNRTAWYMENLSDVVKQRPREAFFSIAAWVAERDLSEFTLSWRCMKSSRIAEWNRRVRPFECGERRYSLSQQYVQVFMHILEFTWERYEYICKRWFGGLL